MWIIYNFAFISLQFWSIVLQISSIVTEVLFSEKGSPCRFANLLIVKKTVRCIQLIIGKNPIAYLQKKQWGMEPSENEIWTDYQGV